MPKPSKPAPSVPCDRMLRKDAIERRTPLQAPAQAPEAARPPAPAPAWPGRTRRDGGQPAPLAPAVPARVDLVEHYRETQVRHLGIRADAIDESARTLRLAFASETREVTVWDWDLGEVPEILSLAPGACDLGPFLNAGSVLRNHRAEDPVAVPVTATIDADKIGRALCRFPQEDPDAARAFIQVRTGLIRGVSVGYRVLAWERVAAGATSSQGHAGPCIVATRWQVREISLTPVPADSSVGVGRTKPPAPTPAITPQPQQRRESVMDPKIVRALVRAAGLSDKFADSLCARNLETIEAVEAAIKTERARVARTNARTAGRRQPAAVGARGDEGEGDDGDEEGRETDEEDEEDEEEEPRARPAPRRRTGREELRNARRQERERCLEIQAAVRNANLGNEFAEDLIERGVGLADALREINAERAEGDVPPVSNGGRGAAPAQPGAGVEMGADAWDKRYRFLLTNLGRRAHAALASYNVGEGSRQCLVGGFEETDETRKVERAHVGLHSFVRELLALQGCREAAHMSPADLWREALDPNAKMRRLRAGAANNASVDLANALSNLQGKALMRAFMAAKPTWRSWCRKGILSDFKIAPSVQLSDFGQLRETLENGEILDSKLDDGAENRQLAIYARRVSMTLQMFVNDDLDALGRLPAMMGKQAAVLPSRLVYTHLLSIPTMRDGVALFHADHGNLETGAGSALGATSLTAMVKNFRKQTGPQAPNDTDLAAEPIDVEPRVLIVPPEKEFAAYQLANPNLFVAETQFFKNKFDIEVEPRLSNSSYTGYSTTAWYLAGAAGECDTMEVSFLNGNESPITGSWDEFEALAVQFRAWLACGAKALDWRTIGKANGA